VSSAFTGDKVYGEPAEFTVWTKVTSKHPYSVSKSRNSEVLQTLKPVSVFKRYTTLSNLLEPTPDKDEAITLRGVNLTQFSASYSKKKKELRKSLKSTIKDHARIQEQRSSSTNYLQTINEQVNDRSNLQPKVIPTIVNGQVSLAKMDGSSQGQNDKLSDIQSFLRESSLDLLINNNKFLGMGLESPCIWKVHIFQLLPKSSKACYLMRVIKPIISIETLRIVYYSYFHSLMTYGLISWGNSSYSLQIFRIQKRIIRIMCGLKPTDSCRNTFKVLRILPLQSQYIYFLYCLLL
jgi:hypothetical protein